MSSFLYTDIKAFHYQQGPFTTLSWPFYPRWAPRLVGSAVVCAGSEIEYAEWTKRLPSRRLPVLVNVNASHPYVNLMQITGLKNRLVKVLATTQHYHVRNTC